MRNLLVLTLVLGVASLANAMSPITLSDGGVSVTIQDAGGNTANIPAGYNSFDVIVDSPDGTDWTLGEMLSVLSSGSFYQNTSAFSGVNVHPNTAFYAYDASVEYDTYVVATSYPAPGQTKDTVTQVAGGAADIGGATAATVDTGKLDITWFDNESPYPDGQVARLTVSNDANGSLDLQMYAEPGSLIGNFMGDVSIANGEVVVPEPVSILMLLLGAVGIIRRR